MIFTESPHDQYIERMMIVIPKFHPRGHGAIVTNQFEYAAKDCNCRLCFYHQKKKGCTVGRCPCIKERIETGASSMSEVLHETMSSIHHQALKRRLRQYICESEENLMKFKNEKHRSAFGEAVRKMNRKNYTLMAALYLLTADHKLWITAKRYIGRNEIHFDSLKPKNSTEDAYTLLCAAKDLYLGTKHLTVCDLADADIISPKMFAFICNAMAIRRFGLGAINYIERKDN